MGRIQDIPQIRALFKPYLDCKRRKAHERYLRSPDSWYLKTLKGIHEGKRCFIIGNGPSLRSEDLDRLTGEYTFGANRIYEIFDQTKWRPSFYLLIDTVGDMQEIYRKAAQCDVGHMFIRLNIKDRKDEAKSLDFPVRKMTRVFFDIDGYFTTYQNTWNDGTAYVSVDVSDHFSNGCTVTFNSIQLAIYMGFAEIYLLGVDFSYSIMRDAKGKVHRDESIQDYFTGKRYDATVFNYNGMLHAYEAAREYCDNHGIKIYNATRGGKLEVFERVEFDKIFGGGSLDS